jgi:hypothetical protein
VADRALRVRLKTAADALQFNFTKVFSAARLAPCDHTPVTALGPDACSSHPISQVWLYAFDVERIYEYYRRIAVAVSMRGHGVMIPFGIGCATISLISHDKARRVDRAHVLPCASVGTCMCAPLSVLTLLLSAGRRLRRRHRPPRVGRRHLAARAQPLGRRHR